MSNSVKYPRFFRNLKNNCNDPKGCRALTDSRLLARLARLLRDGASASEALESMPSCMLLLPLLLVARRLQPGVGFEWPLLKTQKKKLKNPLL